ncbi:CLUMA_CG018611, isoform A [Clunio marinus]|uniref:CLUMA_CG018611, isoform A n=1 Tax=Clunio marinus TaxID=568069 RepID=A0A1J1IZ78_9DIPT|nr:CLUMA_CG018611, isoform A [Clunio marinus]
MNYFLTDSLPLRPFSSEEKNVIKKSFPQSMTPKAFPLTETFTEHLFRFDNFPLKRDPRGNIRKHLDQRNQ